MEKAVQSLYSKFHVSKITMSLEQLAKVNESTFFFKKLINLCLIFPPMSVSFYISYS